MKIHSANMYEWMTDFCKTAKYWKDINFMNASLGNDYLNSVCIGIFNVPDDELFELKCSFVDINNKKIIFVYNPVYDYEKEVTKDEQPSCLIMLPNVDNSVLVLDLNKYINARINEDYRSLFKIYFAMTVHILNTTNNDPFAKLCAAAVLIQDSVHTSPRKNKNNRLIDYMMTAGTPYIIAEKVISDVVPSAKTFISDIIDAIDKIGNIDGLWYGAIMELMVVDNVKRERDFKLAPFFDLTEFLVMNKNEEFIKTINDNVNNNKDYEEDTVGTVLKIFTPFKEQLFGNIDRINDIMDGKEDDIDTKESLSIYCKFILKNAGALCKDLREEKK